MSLKLGNKNISNFTFPKREGLAGALNNYEVVTKNVKEGETITEGEFITLDDRVWYARGASREYPSSSYPISLSKFREIEYHSESDSTYGFAIASHVGTTTNRMCFSSYKIKDSEYDPITQIGSVVVTAGWANYPHLIHFGDCKVLYSFLTYISNKATFCSVLLKNNSDGTWSNSSKYDIFQAASSTNLPSPFGNTTKLTDTTALAVYPSSSGLYGVVLTVNFDSMTITKGTATCLDSNDTQKSSHQLSLYTLDSTHALLKTNDSSNLNIARLHIVTINNGIPELSNYSYQLTYPSIASNGFYAAVVDDSTILFTDTDSTNSYFCIKKATSIKSSFNSVTTVWYDTSLQPSEGSNIWGLSVGTNSIGILYNKGSNLLFRLLDSTYYNKLDDDAILYKYFSVPSGARKGDLINMDSDRFVGAVSSGTGEEGAELYLGVFYMYWDGNKLNYKHDNVTPCNGDSVYGIAATSMSSENTVDIYVPRGN